MTGRPFSGKAKKAQLQAKRAQKAEKQRRRAEHDDQADDERLVESGVVPVTEQTAVTRVEEAVREGLTTRKGKAYKNDKRSVFRKEMRAEVDKRRAAAQIPYEERVFDKGVGFGKWWVGSVVPRSVEIPTRPDWEVTDTEGVINRREEKYLKKYMEAIDATHGQLNMFERNLEVWRQLWRVAETSDVVGIVIDARHPLFHLPTSLVNYITVTLKKPAFVIMNKIDLVPGSVVSSWEEYFKAAHPTLPLIRFTCHPNVETVTLEINSTQYRKHRRRATKKKVNYADKTHAEYTDEEDDGDDSKSSVTTLTSDDGVASYSSCREGVEMFKGEKKFELEEERERAPHRERGEVHKMLQKIKEMAIELGGKDRGSSSPIQLGMVGHPNVGKSSLINALKGEKVVSTSSTAGHTKHLQHIPLNDKLVLCDCPGLTFPITGLPLCIQVLMGSFALAQNREPYSSVHYLGERLPLEKIYHLRKPRGADEGEGWSGWALCESYAEHNGMFLNRGRGIPDCYRAGQAIVKEAVNGVLVLYFLPPPLDAVPKPPLSVSVPVLLEDDDTASEATTVTTAFTDTSDEASSDVEQATNMFANLDGGGKGNKKPGGKRRGRRGGGRKK